MRKITILGILIACCIIYLPTVSYASGSFSSSYGGSFDSGDKSYDSGGSNCGTPETPVPCPPGNTFSFQSLIPQTLIIKEWSQREDGSTYYYTEKEDYHEESDSITHSVQKRKSGSNYTHEVSSETYSNKSCTGDQCTPWEMKTIGETQLSMTVTDNFNGTVKFTFANTGLEAASITDIYFFDDNDPMMLNLAEAVLLNKDGTVFSFDANPAHLPGYSDDPVLSADSDPPPPEMGIEAGEYLDIIIGLGDGKTYAALLAALNDGSFVTGLHVQAFGCGEGSMSFINNLCPTGSLTPVPEPATMLLFGTGLVGLAGTVRRRKKIQK